jgi:AsmA family protein
VRRFLLVVLAATVALPVLAAVGLASWLLALGGDLSPHRDLIAAQLGRILDRPVKLEGELRLVLETQPTLTVTDLFIGNPAWAEAPQLLRVKRLELRSELLPLLRGRLALTRLLVQGAELSLEIDAHGHRSWVFGEEDSVPGPTAIPALSRKSALDLRVEDSTVAYRDHLSGRDWTLAIDAGAIESDAWEAPLAVSLQSTWAGAPLQVKGSTGPLSALGPGTAPYPLDLAGEVLGIRYSATGEITPARLADVRLRVEARAESLDAARAVFGELIPAGTPLQLSLEVSGGLDAATSQLAASVGASRVSARLVLEKDQLTVEDLKVAAKPFEVTGRVAVDTGTSPPAIALTLTAPRIDTQWLPGGRSEGKLSAKADLKLDGLEPAGWLQNGRGTIKARLLGTVKDDEVRIGLRRREGPEALAELDAGGRWLGTPVSLNGTIGTPSHWLSRDRPTPVDLSARLGGISASATGRIADLAHARGIALSVQAQAPRLEDIGALWGEEYPPDGPVRLRTRVEGGPGDWQLADLAAEIGQARATGRLDLRLAGPQPRVEGRLTLDDVRLQSLLPPLAVKATPDGAGATEQRLFSTAPLAFHDLSAVEAEVALDGSRLDLVYHRLPIFEGNLNIAGGKLRLHVGGAEPRETKRAIDFETGSAGSVPTVRLRIQDPQADAASLLAGSAAAGLLSGRVAMDLDLRGQGNSLAAILGSLDGQAHLLMGKGTVNPSSLDRLVVGVRTLFGSLLGTERKTQTLNCAFVDLNARQGVLKGAALLDTETSTFTLDGTIDLARETVELSGTPLQKGLIQLSTSVPVRLTGSLSDPRAEIQKTSTLFRLGLLIAKLNPTTALPAFGLAAFEDISRGNPCVEKIRKAAAGKSR